MTTLALGLFFGALGASGVLVGAGLVLRLRQAWPAIVPALLAFAAGTLLGAAFLGLLPESTARIESRAAMSLALLGVLLFFLLEKTLLWRHCHDPACPTHAAAGYLLLIGDGLHNLVDGLVIGAAFVADPRLGVMTGIAVLAHEVPQEVGDFALLLEGGLTPRRALAYNLLSAVTIFPGVVVGTLLAVRVDTAAGVALAVAAGGFLYVALADLVPALHARLERGMLRDQLLPLLLGVALIWTAGRLEA
jgi:zinc and cadmium transporter